MTLVYSFNCNQFDSFNVAGEATQQAYAVASSTILLETKTAQPCLAYTQAVDHVMTGRKHLEMK